LSCWQACWAGETAWRHDQYGCAAFDGNYYWVPGTSREEVNVFEYADRLKIYQRGQCVAEYVLPADGVRNRVFSPEGMPRPARQPNNRKHLEGTPRSGQDCIDIVHTRTGRTRV
jgi:hypothetical protein